MITLCCPQCLRPTGVSGGRDICVIKTCPNWGKEVKS